MNAILDVRFGGAPMTKEIARLVVQSFRSTSSKNDEPPVAIPGEQEILALLAEGITNKGIAGRLASA